VTVYPKGTGTNGGVPGSGAAGLSAYDLAVQQGYVGTLDQWLASLVGPQGATGPQGPAGSGGSGGLTKAEADATYAPIGTVGGVGDPTVIANAKVPGNYRGARTASTAYAVDDLVVETFNGRNYLYRCLTAHTSSIPFHMDSNKWQAERPVPTVDGLMQAWGFNTITGEPEANENPPSVGWWTPTAPPLRRTLNKRLWTLMDPADIASRSVSATAAPTVDATWPGGALVLATSGLNQGYFNLQPLPAPVDLTGCHLWFPYELAGRDNLGVGGNNIQLSSSAAFDGANYLTAKITSAGVTGQRTLQGFQSIALSDFTVVGGGADPTAIRSCRIAMKANTSVGTSKWQYIDYHPNSAPTAYCVNWFDDGTVGQERAIPIMTRYGFRGCFAFSFLTMMDGQGPLTTPQVQYMQDLGWQVTPHAFGNQDHITSMVNRQAEQQVLRYKGAAKAVGFRGVDDMAYWGGQTGDWGKPDQSTVQMARKYFRSCRTAQILNIETNPVGDPYGMRALQVTGVDANGSAPYKAWIDRAIAAKGILNFVWHTNFSTGAPTPPATITQMQMVAEIMDYLNERRDVIATVTIEEALAATL
jgi:hypothetical protein